MTTTTSDFRPVPTPDLAGLASGRPRRRAGMAADGDWSRWCYAIGRTIGRGVFFLCVRSRVLRPEIVEREGPYILALTHLGNLDPFASGVIIRRRLRWMTRKEFFRYKVFAWILRKVGCFIVNRQGIPVSTIRRAIAILDSGQVVGICPEGGRTLGAEAAIHGGPIKRGICSIAIRSGAPIVPCVMLGTPGLNRVTAWLPFKHGRLWTGFSEPIMPPPGASTRAKRDALRDELAAAYVRLYAEMRRRYGIDDQSM